MEKRRAILINVAYIAFIVAVFYVVIKVFSGIFLPFIAAFLIAALIQRPVKFLSRKTHIGRGPVSAVFVLLLIGVIGLLLFLLGNRIFVRVRGFYDYIMLRMQNLPEFFEDIKEWLVNAIGFLPAGARDSLTQSITVFFDDLIENGFEGFSLSGIGIDWSSLLSHGAGAVKDTVVQIPSVLIGIVISVVAAVFMTIEYDEILAFIALQLPAHNREKLKTARTVAVSTLKKMLKAYSLIVLITTTELCIGFYILKLLKIFDSDYIIFISIIIAIIDIIPVLGTGTVLIPWAVYCFVTGSVSLGVGLIVMYAVILVIRVFTLGAPYRPEWSVNGALGFLWNPDFSILKNGKVWLAAAGQVFFSTSVGIGVLMTYATYLKPKDDILLPATSACFLNEMAEVVLGASIVIPAAFLFFGPADTQTAIAGGTFGLAFRTTPLIFNSMPWGGLFGFLWFLLLFIACVTSSVSILQPGIAFLEEEFHFSRKRCVLCIGALVFAVAHLAIFGDGVVDVMDFWFSEFGLPMFGLIEALVFVFIFGKTRGWEEMTRNSAIRLPRFFRPIVFGVMPLFLATILITWLVSDGWQKVLMLKRGADGHLVSLYTPSQLPWVIATTLVVLATTAGFCWLIRLAWKSPQHRE